MLPDAGCEQGPFIGRVLPFSDDNLRVHFRSVTLERQGLPPTSYLAGGIGRRKPRIFFASPREHIAWPSAVNSDVECRCVSLNIFTKSDEDWGTTVNLVKTWLDEMET